MHMVDIDKYVSFLINQDIFTQCLDTFIQQHVNEKVQY